MHNLPGVGFDRQNILTLERVHPPRHDAWTHIHANAVYNNNNFICVALYISGMAKYKALLRS